jgi:hypothetical protein
VRKRIKIHDSIRKPTKHCIKKVGEGNGNIMEGGTCPKYIVRVYGIITVKPLLLLMYTTSK